jgi:hypothetical protein
MTTPLVAGILSESGDFSAERARAACIRLRSVRFEHDEFDPAFADYETANVDVELTQNAD